MAAKSRTVATYETLKSNLLDGVYAPDTKLKIDQICKDLDVSPGAVREALSRLTSDGLVLSEPQRGFLTAPISAADLMDLTSVRIEIETKCLRRSIQLGDLAWEGQIKSIWHQLQHTPEVAGPDARAMNARWTELHSSFHDSLIGACDSAWRLRLRGYMFMQAERYRRMLLPYMKIERNTQEEHAQIVEATLSRNADLACDLLSKHLQKTADLLLASDAPFSDVPPARKASKRAMASEVA